MLNPLRTVACVLGLLAVAHAERQVAYDLLVIVGSVSHESARVLIELLPEKPTKPHPARIHPHALTCAEATLLVCREDTDTEQCSMANATLWNEPQVLSLGALAPSTRYSFQILPLQDTDQPSACEYALPEAQPPVEANFRTMPPPGVAPKPPYTAAVLSCDCYIDDEDDGLWETLLPAVGALPIPGIDAIMHIGDQVYADTLDGVILSGSYNVTFEALVEMFEDQYRFVWDRPAMKVLMRAAAHFMLPDDHDMINNADSFLVREEGLATADLTVFDIYPDSNDAHKLRSIILAGALTTLEYQTSLAKQTGDRPASLRTQCTDDEPKSFLSSLVRRTKACPSMDMSRPQWRVTARSLIDGSYPDVDFKFQIGRFAVYNIDTRIDRVFGLERRTTWLSPRQVDALDATLAQWKEDGSVSSVALMFGSPLLFMSNTHSKIAMWWEKERYSTLDTEQNITLAVLDTIWKHRDTVDIVMGGDVHLYAETAICRAGNDSDCIPQVITSGMTRISTTIGLPHLYLFQLFNQKVFAPSIGNYSVKMPATEAEGHLGNNFVLLQIGAPDEDWSASDFLAPGGDMHGFSTVGSPTQRIQLGRWRGLFVSDGQVAVRWMGVRRLYTSQKERIMQDFFNYPAIGGILLVLLLCAALYCVVGVLSWRPKHHHRPAPAKPKND